MVTVSVPITCLFHSELHSSFTGLILFPNFQQILILGMWKSKGEIPFCYS